MEFAIRALVLSTLALTMTACMPEPEKPSAPAPPPRQPDRSYLPVPYGTYRGTAPDISAQLSLKQDHSFVLIANIEQQGQQHQWIGWYEWKKADIDVQLVWLSPQQAVNGRRLPMTRDEQLGVFGIDRKRGMFTLQLPDLLGSVDFQPW